MTVTNLVVARKETKKLFKASPNSSVHWNTIQKEEKWISKWKWKNFKQNFMDLISERKKKKKWKTCFFFCLLPSLFLVLKILIYKYAQYILKGSVFAFIVFFLFVSCLLLSFLLLLLLNWSSRERQSRIQPTGNQKQISSPPSPAQIGAFIHVSYKTTTWMMTI